MSEGSKGGSGRETKRGFGTSPALERKERTTERDFEAPEHRPDPDQPQTEIEYIREKGPPRLLEGRWRAYELWTGQHIYVLADDLECMEVIDRRSGQADPDSEIVGARLVGGELRDDEGLIREVSHPLPQRGARAVFSKAVGERQRMTETSATTRIVMRQRVVSLVPPEKKPPSWKRITGRHDLP